MVFGIEKYAKLMMKMRKGKQLKELDCQIRKT